MKSTEQGLADLLTQGLRPYELKLEQQQVAAIADGWAAWRARQDARASDTSELLAVRYLQERLATGLREISDLREGQARFTRRCAQVGSPEELRRVILDYALELGASRRQLRGDARALRRWFDADAMHDRVRVRIANLERSTIFCLKSLGRMAARVLRHMQDQKMAWELMRLEQGLYPLLEWDGDPRVRLEAFRALSAALRELLPGLALHAVGKELAAFIVRSSLDKRLDVWIQREALLLLSCCDVQRFADTVERRLRDAGDGDDLFVRRFAVERLGVVGISTERRDLLIGIAVHDSSPYVRQAVAQALACLTPSVAQRYWPVLGIEDPTPQVRAAAILQIPRLATQAAHFEAMLHCLGIVLRKERTSFCLRVALRSVEEGALSLEGARQQLWMKTLLPLVEELHVECPVLAVRRWAAEARERIVCQAGSESRALAREIAVLTRECEPGNAADMAVPVEDVDSLGRVLACTVQRDHGLDLERRGGAWRAWRGHRFGFRMWRFLHEWKHPSPDKRQAFRHTVGRVFHGTVRAPSGILAELAQTKVPGEPLHMSSEAGWRPYLPLVDELISLLDESPSSGPLRLYTAEGRTEIAAPSSLTKRLAMRMKLTRDFEKYARARNWNEGSSADPGSYLKMIGELGFEVRYQPYPGTRADPAVTRFFPGLPAFAAFPLPEMHNRLENYFYSAYDNSLFDLAVFTGVAMAGFLGHHVWVNLRMRAARRALPLVIGGWGTRGKSGTERLKAGLFNALGYGVVSKTTGCEAMFLYAPPQGELREMFLFRPYDKATIWEQYNVVRLANRLGCEVFLWECMALTPAFVRLLQRSWMRDDYSTITNTFPDHEDLQGPAGINIPQVMTEFIPEKRVVLTAEEQMRPILQSAADALGTELKGVGWLESGLIAPDILARFPYQEHPDNIALVAALGTELGIDYDFSLKAMADKVVPDLGVLKTFPVARVGSRRLEFSNGMSANERYGCLGNWERLGLARQDPFAEPGVCISTVVNNRADRVARSRVFAGVLTQDIRADFHVLIGSNLDGLRGYIKEAWHAHAQGLSLKRAHETEETPVRALERIAREYRVVHADAHVSDRLAVMLKGIGAPEQLVEHAGDVEALGAALAQQGIGNGGALLDFHARDLRTLSEYRALETRCQRAGETAADLDAALREQMGIWFERRIVVVEDYYASGDAVIATIRDATPPGFVNRIIGLQNIKGTGLDFVYRWLAWESCHKACQDLLSADPAQQRRGLASLARFQEFGLLCETETEAALAALQATPQGQKQHVRAEIKTIAARMTERMAQIDSSASSARVQGWKEKVINFVEGFLDAGDAVRRRRRSDRIYDDLVNRRISEARAALELQALTRRQKGGWLGEAISAWGKRLSERLRIRDSAARRELGRSSRVPVPESGSDVSGAQAASRAQARPERVES
ncbi:MAG TPA: hypothetical protein VM406_12370 [Noviherbaspirillum sp.]|nr:hypothetical protein [Noviherbaspirillum sp.]